jgi:hypothetical protein
MPVYPWISINKNGGTTTLRAHRTSLSDVCAQGVASYPSLVTLIGRQRKARLLSQMLSRPPYPPSPKLHGQVCLIPDPMSAKDDVPIVYIDCELQHTSGLGPHLSSKSSTTMSVDWLNGDEDTVDKLSDIFVSNVLVPISNVVCYFAADFQGIQGIASLLARQGTRPTPHTLPRAALPHVLVVVETESKLFDPIIAQKKLHASIIATMGDSTQHMEVDKAEEDFQSKFNSVQILGLQKTDNDKERIFALHRRLTSLAQEAHWGRRSSGYLFKGYHIDAFADRILSTFCRDKSLFNFLRVSRPKDFIHRDLQTHLDELLRICPSQTWLWSIVIPLVASSILLANYPPGSHG